MDSNTLFDLAKGVNDSYKRAFEEGRKQGWSEGRKEGYWKAMEEMKEIRDKERKGK